MSWAELFNGLAYVVGGFVFFLAARKRKLATDGFLTLALVGMVAGVVGAKVTQLLFQGVAVSQAFDPRLGGRALLGGMICGWIGVEVAKRQLGIKRSTGDLFALALTSGEAVGRIGCFLGGCCYGSETTCSWAVYQHDAYRHPAQIYSAVTAAAMFVGLAWLYWKLNLKEGMLFRLYLLLFGASRFVIEFFRQRDSLIFGLSPMQWFCLELIVTAAVLLALPVLKARRARA
ncbi:MAG TPA: prolipoprotein diacylglyceryl transferase family protein [Fimbriimonas sp.]|nr:prolipoprotein diacylglyceryl transferase family protein [Fimbriimonas sp.]